MSNPTARRLIWAYVQSDQAGPFTADGDAFVVAPRDLIEDFASASACVLDAEGHCGEHGWRTSEVGCPTRGREISCPTKTGGSRDRIVTGWLALGIYAIGYCACFIKAYPILVDDCHGEPDTEDRALAAAAAAVISLFWPPMIPIYALQRLARKGSVKERQSETDQRERELSAREERIAQLERELGVGKSQP